MSFELNLKKLRYHLCEVDTELVLSYDDGNGTRATNGFIIDVHYNNNNVKYAFEALIYIDGVEHSIIFLLEDTNYEFSKILALKNKVEKFPKLKDATISELFIETISIGDKMTHVYIDWDYNALQVAQYMFKSKEIEVSSISKKTISFKAKYSNSSRHFSKKFTKRNGILLASRRYIDFVSFKKISEYDIGIFDNIFKHQLKILDTHSLVDSGTGEICNKAVRDYNNNIAFSYLDTIYVEEIDETREN
jgi:hypothetical protein